MPSPQQSVKPPAAEAASQAAELLTELNKAVASANEAATEHVSRSKQVGLLLLKAKKLYPAVKDFEAFLKKVQGLQLSRAYDCMRIAGGRTTEDEIRKTTRERVKKHRAKQLPKAKPVPRPRQEPEPEPFKLSVTSANVTEIAEASAEKRKAQNADLDVMAEQKAAKSSAHYLAEFSVACRTYLPKITVEADRQKARFLVAELTSNKSNAEAA